MSDTAHLIQAELAATQAVLIALMGRLRFIGVLPVDLFEDIFEEAKETRVIGPEDHSRTSPAEVEQKFLATLEQMRTAALGFDLPHL